MWPPRRMPSVCARLGDTSKALLRWWANTDKQRVGGCLSAPAIRVFLLSWVAHMVHSNAHEQNPSSLDAPPGVRQLLNTLEVVELLEEAGALQLRCQDMRGIQLPQLVADLEYSGGRADMLRAELHTVCLTLLRVAVEGDGSTAAVAFCAPLLCSGLQV